MAESYFPAPHGLLTGMAISRCPARRIARACSALFDLADDCVHARFVYLKDRIDPQEYF